jgi:hypothetical protein
MPEPEQSMEAILRRIRERYAAEHAEGDGSAAPAGLPSDKSNERRH